MKVADKLFELLDDSDASTLTLIPQDSKGKSRGVIVVVCESQTQAFLEFLEGWKTPEKLDYGWTTK